VCDLPPNAGIIRAWIGVVDGKWCPETTLEITGGRAGVTVGAGVIIITGGTLQKANRHTSERIIAAVDLTWVSGALCSAALGLSGRCAAAFAVASVDAAYPLIRITRRPLRGEDFE
jgi:hypothetical protein